MERAGIRGVLALLLRVLCALTFGGRIAVLLPVVRMAFMPSALAAFLVFSVIRIALHLLVLPTPSPSSLAGWHGAVSLIRDLRARDEGLAAACASPNSCHGVLPDESRISLAVSSPLASYLRCLSVKGLPAPRGARPPETDGAPIYQPCASTLTFAYESRSISSTCTES